MLSPGMLHMAPEASNNNYIVGPLMITFSVLSYWEINASAIKANILFGGWLLAALFILPYGGMLTLLSNGCCGVLAILLSIGKRRRTQALGGGWRSLFQHHPLHMVEAEKRSSKR